MLVCAPTPRLSLQLLVYSFFLLSHTDINSCRTSPIYRERSSNLRYGGRDSSLGSCSCVSRTSVPPSQSISSTVTTLSRCSQSSSSSQCQVKTIFLSGCNSRYSPRIVISSPSELVSSQQNFPPTRASATILRV